MITVKYSDKNVYYCEGAYISRTFYIAKSKRDENFGAKMGQRFIDTYLASLVK